MMRVLRGLSSDKTKKIKMKPEQIKIIATIESLTSVWDVKYATKHHGKSYSALISGAGWAYIDDAKFPPGSFVVVAAKYKSPVLLSGGIHATYSEYLAPSTGHTIEIKRSRRIGKSAHNNYSPNEATVRDSEGNYVRIPRSVRRSPGAIAKYLLTLTPTTGLDK